VNEPAIPAAVRPRQFIKCTARGSRWRIAKIVAARGLPFAFVKEIREGDLVETVGIVELEYKREVAAWFRDSIGRSDDALLAYAVTTDEREFIRQTEQEERIEAAKRDLAERAKRKAAKRKTTKRKAPAPDAGASVVNLSADKAADRARSRRRARAQHNARTPITGDADLLPADETANPSPAGAGQTG
jgi:hypothetical protein